MRQSLLSYRCLILACLTSMLALPALAAAARVDVAIAGLQFTPATVTVHVGDTVVWTNNDDRDHSVVAADKSFKSANIKSGQKFEFTFTKPGAFVYGCSYHPRMKGTVVVK